MSTGLHGQHGPFGIHHKHCHDGNKQLNHQACFVIDSIYLCEQFCSEAAIYCGVTGNTIILNIVSVWRLIIALWGLDIFLDWGDTEKKVKRHFQ